MSIFNHHSAEIVILLFFFITFFISVLEKVSDWKGTVAFYTDHFKKTILHKMITFLLINVVVLETVIVFLVAAGLYYLVTEESMLVAKIGLELSAIVLLLFLTAQRLAKDYSGAMNITVYFILNCLGIYLLT